MEMNRNQSRFQQRNPWETPEQQITHPLTQCRNQSSAQKPVSCLTSISLVNSLFSQILKRKRKISIKTHCWKGFKCGIQIQSFRHKLKTYSICLKWTQEHLSIKIKPGNFVPLGVVLYCTHEEGERDFKNQNEIPLIQTVFLEILQHNLIM